MENNQIKKWEPIDFAIYLKFALPWALLAVAIEILFRLLAHRPGFFSEYKDYIVWVIRIVAIAFITRRKFMILGTNTAIGAIAGIIFGAVIGFVASFYMLFDGFKAWKVFNLFTETVYMAVLCAAVLVVVSSIVSKRMNKKANETALANSSEFNKSEQY